MNKRGHPTLISRQVHFWNIGYNYRSYSEMLFPEKREETKEKNISLKYFTTQRVYTVKYNIRE